MSIVRWCGTSWHHARSHKSSVRDLGGHTPGTSCLLRMYGPEARYGACLPEFLPSNAVTPCFSQNCCTKMFSVRLQTQKSISAGALPGPQWVKLTPLPRPPSWWAEGLAVPHSQEPHPRLGPSGLELRPFLGIAPPCLLTFDYPPLPLFRLLI